MVFIPKIIKLYRSRSRTGSSSNRLGIVTSAYFKDDTRFLSRTGNLNRINSRSGSHNMSWHWGPPPLRPEDFAQIYFNKDLIAILKEHI